MAQTFKVLGISIFLALALAACTDSIGERYVGFAECITQKGARMYGAYWCPHCANQKKLFGREGFKKVAYVECDPRGANAKPDVCNAEKVKSYPTWKFADSTVMTGEVSLEKLAEKTQCALPVVVQE